MSQLSVLLPIYNSEKYLARAIESVLDQSFSDFELLLLNDGSSDSSLKIAESFKDSRIRIINNPKNQGLIDTLNIGINAAASNKYICRMDADDICEKDRFEKQIQFLNKHPEIDVVGTNIMFIDKKGKEIDRSLEVPADPNFIFCLLTRSVCVLHPTVMLRKEVYNSFQYQPAYKSAEDYDLWTRVSFRYKISNLPEKLLRYRIHDESISHAQRGNQMETSYKVSHSYIQNRFDLKLPLDFVKFYFDPKNHWFVEATAYMTQLKTAMEQQYPSCSGLIKREFFSILIRMFYTALTKKNFIQATKMVPRLLQWFSWSAASQTLRSFIDRRRS
ncbi:MAG: glycosyltransferase [Bdellovibrionota bacterium]